MIPELCNYIYFSAYGKCEKNDATLFLKLHIVLFSKLETKRVTIFCVYENDFNIQMFMYMFYKLNNMKLPVFDHLDPQKW